jgi:hypothetical protein
VVDASNRPERRQRREQDGDGDGEHRTGHGRGEDADQSVGNSHRWSGAERSEHLEILIS